MAELPDYQKPPDAVVEHINQWYDPHRRRYTRVFDRLERMRQLWGRSSTRTREALLKFSYLNSVFSVQTPVERHERALRLVVRGRTPREALIEASAGHYDKKGSSTMQTLADDDLWNDVLGHLANDRIDAAHHRLLDAGWLGTAKAPFTLANLGFVQKMCIDANVARVMKGTNPSQRISVDEYEGLCADIQAMFPDLAEFLEPYELQWVIFDWQRFYRSNSEGGPARTADAPGDQAVAEHRIFFDAVFGRRMTIVDRLEELTLEAQAAGNGEPESVTDLEQFRDQIEEAIQSEIGDEAAQRRIRRDLDRAIEQRIASD